MNHKIGDEVEVIEGGGFWLGKSGKIKGFDIPTRIYRVGFQTSTGYIEESFPEFALRQRGTLIQAKLTAEEAMQGHCARCKTRIPFSKAPVPQWEGITVCATCFNTLLELYPAQHGPTSPHATYVDGFRDGFDTGWDKSVKTERVGA